MANRPDDATGVRLDISAQEDGVSFRVRATPRARASAIAGITDGALVLRVAAPPVEGKANEAICVFLARVLGVRPSAVRIAAGDRARHKRVEVRGISRADVQSLLEGGEPERAAPKSS